MLQEQTAARRVHALTNELKIFVQVGAFGVQE